MTTWVVRCFYGNVEPNALYARGIRTREEAERLCERARSLGYDDAEVMDAESFKEKCRAAQRGEAYQGRPARKRRAM